MIEADIMALVHRIRETREACRLAGEARRVALDALRAADRVMSEASNAFQVAQNALVVAAGWDDRSWIFGSPDVSTEEVVQAAK